MHSGASLSQLRGLIAGPFPQGYDVLLFLDSIEEVLCSVPACPLKNTAMTLRYMIFHDSLLVAGEAQSIPCASICSKLVEK